MVFVMSPDVEAQKNDIFVNPNTGNDQNGGSQEQPVKTLFEAARRVNWVILRSSRFLPSLDELVIPNHLGVLASGQGIVVDHCVFYKCKDAVVYWFSDKPAEGCEMHHNLMIDNYGAAVWSWTVAEDFKFYNNVVSNNNVFWEVGRDENRTYTISNSIVVGYNSLVNKGGGAFGYGEPTDPKRLKYGNDVIIKKEGSLQIEKDPTKRNFLHLIPGTLGSDMGAGLFTKLQLLSVWGTERYKRSETTSCFFL